jgi:hypothetical protein
MPRQLINTRSGLSTTRDNPPVAGAGCGLSTVEDEPEFGEETGKAYHHIKRKFIKPEGHHVQMRYCKSA